MACVWVGGLVRAPGADSNQVLVGTSASAAPSHFRSFGAGDLLVEVDLSTQLLQLDIPQDITMQWFDADEPVQFDSGQTNTTPIVVPVVQAPIKRTRRIEAVIEPVLKPSAAGERFVSASMLIQKAKLFDDRVVASIELAAQRGTGRFPSKAEFLSTLASKLSEKGLPPTSARATSAVLGAAELGRTGYVTPEGWKEAVSKVVFEFRASPHRSQPMGFYTWSEELKQIFQQDRLLATELEAGDGVQAAADVLKSDQKLLAAYEACLELNAGIECTSASSDLRSLWEGISSNRAPERTRRYCFLPPSESLESRLAKECFAGGRVPDGFDLVAEIVKRVQEGRLPLAPNASSGWYAYQTWALEPLLLPDQAVEAVRLQLQPEYRRQLVALFKAALALGRETHIKQLETPEVTAEVRRPPPKVKISIVPELSVEPLPTLFARQAEGYRFLRRVLDARFGEAGVAAMSLVGPAGGGTEKLAPALGAMEALFDGAAVASCKELGLEPPISSKATASADLSVYQSWAAGSLESDLGADVRMMVPVYYDLARRQTRVWVMLGWTTRPLVVSFARPPTVKVTFKDGRLAPAESYDLQFGPIRKTLSYPVTAEVYVSRLLDREEFRRHCDRYRTQSEILKHLE